jgi:tRNA pseudouridine13 synthase
VGDRVMGMDEEGTRTHLVTAMNRERVQKELDLGRATVTALLPGLTAPLAEGEMGAIEQEVLDAHGIDLADFRVREIPEVASEGRRRGILQPVRDLDVHWVGEDSGKAGQAGPRTGVRMQAQGPQAASSDGLDPVFSFALGKGSYATVVMREFMKVAGPDS